MPWDSLQKRTLVLASVIFGSSFCVNSVLPLAFLDMTRDAAMNLNSAAVARLNSVGMLVYGLGKIFGGAGVDALGGQKALAVIHATLSVSYAFLARASGLTTGMTVSFLAMRVVQAMSMQSTLLVVRGWFKDNRMPLAMSITLVASRVGAWLGSFLGGFFLARTKSWRGLLGASAALTACTTVTALSFLSAQRPIVESSNSESHVVAVSDVTKERTSPTKKALSLSQILRIGASTPKLLLIYGSNTMLTSSFNFGTMLPQYLSEVYALDDVSIGRIAGAFPLMTSPVILISSMILEVLGASGQTIYLLGTEAAAVVGYMLLSVRLPRKVLIPAISAVGLGFGPAFYCVPSPWIFNWGGPNAGLFSGLSDVGGNIVTMVLYAFLPALLKRGGWQLVMRLQALQVALGIACLAVFRRLETISPTRSSPFVLEDAQEKTD